MPMKVCPVCNKVQIVDTLEMCASCNYKKSKQPVQSNSNTKFLEQIAIELKHINWNLGKLYLYFKGDQETIKKIEEAESKE